MPKADDQLSPRIAWRLSSQVFSPRSVNYKYYIGCEQRNGTHHLFLDLCLSDNWLSSCLSRGLGLDWLSSGLGATHTNVLPLVNEFFTTDLRFSNRLGWRFLGCWSFAGLHSLLMELRICTSTHAQSNLFMLYLGLLFLLLLRTLGSPHRLERAQKFGQKGRAAFLILLLDIGGAGLSLGRETVNKTTRPFTERKIHTALASSATVGEASD